jgi:hypothetical protein
MLFQKDTASGSFYIYILLLLRLFIYLGPNLRITIISNFDFLIHHEKHKTHNHFRESILPGESKTIDMEIAANYTTPQN